MNTKIFFLVFAVCTSSIAQDLPPPLQELANKRITKIKKGTLTKEQHEMYWKNTVEDTEGFFRIKSSKAAVDLLEYTAAMPQLVTPAEGTRSIKGFTPFGVLQEDPYRNSTIYRNSAGQAMMITIWNYGQAGVKLTYPEDFLNATIGSHDCTVTLAFAEETDHALWKAACISPTTMMEVYMTDTLSRDGHPSFSLKHFMTLTRLVVNGAPSN